MRGLDQNKQKERHARFGEMAPQVGPTRESPCKAEPTETSGTRNSSGTTWSLGEEGLVLCLGGCRSAGNRSRAARVQDQGRYSKSRSWIGGAAESQSRPSDPSARTCAHGDLDDLGSSRRRQIRRMSFNWADVRRRSIGASPPRGLKSGGAIGSSPGRRGLCAHGSTLDDRHGCPSFASTQTPRVSGRSRRPPS